MTSLTSSSRKANVAQQIQRLAAAKIMIKDSGGAMPTMARELRREACETIDEIIQELRG